MKARRRYWLVAGIIFLAAMVLVAGTALIAWVFFRPFASGRVFELFGREFQSNGERIYFTGASATGPPITSEMPGMHRMQPGMMACADCHGERGEGGTVQMMMSAFEAPNIQYNALTGAGHDDDHTGHPPYNEETLKRAITEGVDPAGEPLNWAMPRWDMTEEQLDDLVEYLKTLE